MEYKEAYAFLNGAKKRAILSRDNEEWVKLNIVDLVKNHSNSADMELYRRIDEIDKKFKEFYRNNKIKAVQTDNVFRTVMRAVKKQNQSFNDELCNLTSEELGVIYNVACIYNSLNNTFGVDGLHEADDIITLGFAKSLERNRRLNKKLRDDNTFVSNVEALLKTLTSNNGSLPANEQFEPAEVKQLFTQTVCLIYTTNKIKAEKTREILNNYLDNLRELAKDRPNEKEFLDKATAKSLILRAGTILIPSPAAIQESLDLLTGKRAGELVLQKSNRDKRNQEIVKSYPYLHIEGFDLDKHLYMLQKRVTLIPRLSIQALAAAQNQIIDGLAGGLIKNADKLSLQEKTIRLEKLGIKTDSLIHADNVSELVLINPAKSAEKQTYFAQNINLFSRVLPVADLQKLVCHNIALLYQPTSLVEGKLAEILNGNKGDMAKCKQDLEQFVNSKFSIIDRNNEKSAIVKSDPVLPELETEEFDVDDNKDYIDLNLSKLRAQIRTTKQNVHIPYVNTITPENYDNMLYQELVTLGAYLDAKEKKSKPNLAPDSLGGMLNKINSGKASQSVNGAMKTRLAGIKKMIDYLNDETSPKDGVTSGVSSLQNQINARLAVLESEINSTTAVADEVFMSDYNRGADSELINEYRQVLALAKQTMQATKSKALLKSLMQDCEFYEAQILELEKQNKKVSDGRSDYKNLYADRANLLEERQFLQDISSLLSGVWAKKSAEKQPDQIENVDISSVSKVEDLKMLLEARKRKFSRIYTTEQAQKSSRARREKEKIEEIKEKLEQLEKSREKV